jgi:hypothetical protein
MSGADTVIGVCRWEPEETPYSGGGKRNRTGYVDLFTRDRGPVRTGGGVLLGVNGKILQQIELRYQYQALIKQPIEIYLNAATDSNWLVGLLVYPLLLSGPRLTSFVAPCSPR